MRPVDRNGVPLREGAFVRLVRADPGLLRGLPIEDRQAIEQVRQEGALLFVGTDRSTGNLELEFTDHNGGMHWISVNPQDVAVA